MISQINEKNKELQNIIKDEVKRKRFMNFLINHISLHSASIENTRAYMIEVTKKGLEIEDRELKNCVFTNQKNLKIGENQIIDLYFINDMHKDLMIGVLPYNELGVYRESSAYILNEFSDFVESRFIPEKMLDFIKNIQESKKHPVQTAMDAHLDFVCIHPFVDGNGRTARILMNAILLKNGYVPFFIKDKDREEYLDAIKSTSNGQEGRSQYYGFMLKVMEHSYSQSLKHLKGLSIKFMPEDFRDNRKINGPVI